MNDHDALYGDAKIFDRFSSYGFYGNTVGVTPNYLFVPFVEDLISPLRITSKDKSMPISRCTSLQVRSCSRVGIEHFPRHSGG